MDVVFKHYPRNQLRYLRAQIDSALESSFDDFELTISVEDVENAFNVLDGLQCSSSVEAN